jgi:very-short-patch-repair endonuclease
MPAKNIVIGQKINPAKAERARQLRRRMTPEEKILWEALRANRLGGFHFRRQQVISGFIVDFYCHAAGIVVELDGGIHQQQRGYDAARDRALTARGLRVLRIPNQRVHANLPGVLAQVLAACHESTPSAEP